MRNKSFAELARALHSLTVVECCWLACAMLGLPLMGLGLQLFGFRRLLALLTMMPISATSYWRWNSLAHALRTSPDSIARMVRIAAAYGLYRATCLPQSLTIWWLLRCLGFASELHIGVRRLQGGLQAHAWVTYQGQIVGDTDISAKPFLSFDIQ